MPEVDTENVREAVCSSKWMTLGCRLKTQDYARVEAAAKAAGLRNPSVWLKNVVLRALTGRPGNQKAAAAGAALSVEEAWETQRQQMVPLEPGRDVTLAEPHRVPPVGLSVVDGQDLPKLMDEGLSAIQEAFAARYSSAYPQRSVIPTKDEREAMDAEWVKAHKPCRSWSDEWDKFMQMDPQEATERFTELQAGRALPGGFKAWTKDRKIAWLDAHWPLEGK